MKPTSANLHPVPFHLPISDFLPARPQQVFPLLQIGELLFVHRKLLEDRPIRQTGQPNATRPNVTLRVANPDDGPGAVPPIQSEDGHSECRM